jgi:hypothetical protein
MDNQFWDPTEHIHYATLCVDTEDQEKVKGDFVESALIHNISLLPRDMIGRIYIHAMRKFWRKYVPLTGKPPSWLHRKNYVDKILWNARYQNIHFLHLPFNTLPQNKQYIRGCRCYDCCMATRIDTEKHPLIRQRLPYSSHEGGVIIWDANDIERRVNSPGEKINTHFLKKTMLVNTLKNTRKPIDFSEETKAIYSQPPTSV